MASPADPVDGQRNDSWDLTSNEAFTTNIKRVVDDYADLANQQARAAQKQSEAVWTQFLDQNRQWQAIAQQAAINLTQHSQRAAASAQTWDSLIVAGEVDTTAQGAMANNLANQMRSIAFEAVQAAMAQTQQTSAPAQGTTGVAQGAMQTGTGIADVAILAQIAKLAEAVNVIYLKVLGEENTAEGITA